MNIPAEHMALRFARMWVMVYTAALPWPIRHARRAEIESDLWEHTYDRVIERRGENDHDLFWRVVLGIPSDLSWAFMQRFTYRREHPMEAIGSRRRTHYIVIAVAVVITTLLMIMSTTGGGVAVGVVTLAAFIGVVVVANRRRGSIGSSVGSETTGTDRGERSRLIRIATASTLVMIAIFIFGALSEEFSAVWWTVFASLFVVSLLTTIGTLIFLAANLRTPRPEQTQLPARQYRLRLAGVVVVSVITMIAVATYAASLESWGELGSVVFNGVFLLGLATSIGALVLLAIDFLRPQAG
jgi:hypothetical protein